MLSIRLNCKLQILGLATQHKLHCKSLQWADSKTVRCLGVVVSSKMLFFSKVEQQGQAE